MNSLQNQPNFDLQNEYSDIMNNQMNITKDNQGSDGHSHNETDAVTALELQAKKRVLYFSDGVMEEMWSSESDDDVDMAHKDIEINENEFDTIPRLRYKARQMVNNILSGIDYVGGGIASFLGITTPKFGSESDYFKRAIENEDNSDDNIDVVTDFVGGSNGRNNNSHNVDNQNEAIIMTQPHLQRHQERAAAPNQQ